MQLDAQRLERVLAYHCGAALSGIKPADLVSWRLQDGDEALLAEYEALLAQRGVRLRVLQKNAQFWLLLIYRPALLEQSLSRPEVSAMLTREGYPVSMGAEAMLEQLTLRLKTKDFPHEIGLFLGYPAEDVEGFRKHGGRNYKLSGLWKVYGQVDEAVRLFRTFDRCRDHLCSGLDKGMTLVQLLPAV